MATEQLARLHASQRMTALALQRKGTLLVDTTAPLSAAAAAALPDGVPGLAETASGAPLP